MWAPLYLALFGFAIYLTHLWLVSKTEVQVTSLFATGAWFFLALSGGTLDHVSGGEEVTVITTGAFQMFCLAFGALSLIAAVGYQMNVYPAEETGIEAEEFSAR